MGGRRKDNNGHKWLIGFTIVALAALAANYLIRLAGNSGEY